MRGGHSARIGLLLLALWPGCGDSCACGQGGGADRAQSASESSATGGGRAWPAPAPGDVREGAARGGGGSGAPAPQPGWTPAPDSELTRRLRGAKQALDTEKVYDKLAAEAALGGVLGDKLGTLKADGAASSAVREGDGAKLAVSARNYKDGSKTVRVKVIDTALMPSARRVVSNRLLMLGNATVGEERGVFVRGYPAVLAHFAEQKVSRANVMVDGRYLVQVMVRDASGPDEALRILEQLDWAKLAPKQGKLPAPVAPPP